jgi:hypothetical protein
MRSFLREFSNEAPEPSTIFGCLHANAFCGRIMGLNSFRDNHKEKRYEFREGFCALESILSWLSSPLHEAGVGLPDGAFQMDHIFILPEFLLRLPTDIGTTRNN